MLKTSSELREEFNREHNQFNTYHDYDHYAIWLEEKYIELQKKTSSFDDVIRSSKEVEKVIEIIKNNDALIYGYKTDVLSILNWFLMGEDFDGLSGD